VNHFSQTMLFCITFLVTLYFTLLCTTPVAAWELRAGLSAMEEGDDRLRGGLLLHFEQKNWDLRLFNFSRAYGPVVQTTRQLSIDRAYSLPFFASLSGIVGGAFLQQITDIRYHDAQVDAFDAYDNDYNIGFNTGLIWKYKTKGAHTFAVSWQSTLFMAGQAFIFLVTGRKQFLSVESGMEF
jgi:hypothetical protein